MTAWHRRGSPGADLALAVMQLEAQPVELVADALSAVQDPAEAIERLSFHGAWGHAHRKGSAQGLQFPSWLADEGAGRRAWALENHLRALHDMAELRTVLDAAGVPWLTFKGPTLSVLYGQPDLRGYTDLDVLVSPADLPAAVTALLDGGWPFIDWQSSLDRRPPMGVLHLTGPAGTPVDLHWHLFYRAPTPAAAVLIRLLSSRPAGTHGSAGAWCRPSPWVSTLPTSVRTRRPGEETDFGGCSTSATSPPAPQNTNGVTW